VAKHSSVVEDDAHLQFFPVGWVLDGIHAVTAALSLQVLLSQQNWVAKHSFVLEDDAHLQAFPVGFLLDGVQGIKALSLQVLSCQQN